MEDNSCKEHIGQACIKFAGRHYHLTKYDISAWSMHRLHSIEYVGHE